MNRLRHNLQSLGCAVVVIVLAVTVFYLIHLART